MNMHCVLCSLSRAWPSPFTPLNSFLPTRAWCTPSPHPPTPPHPPPRPTSSTPPPLHRHWHRCMCCCMAPRRLAWHWPPTPQDHSGTLGAEEFKACLISLGFDIANDAQVLNRSSSPAARSLTGFFFFFLLVFFPSRISILPLFPPLLRIPLA